MSQTDTANLSMGERRMLGLDLDAWNDVMIAALAFGALAAVIVGVSTFAVIRLQKVEVQSAAAEFDRYKLDTEKKISEANARAAEAALSLEKLRTPRAQLLTPEALASIVAKLKPFAGTKIDIGHATENREVLDFLWRLEPVFEEAGWVHVDWVGGQMFKKNNWPGDHWYGVASVSDISVEVRPAFRDTLMPAADALADALRSIGIAVHNDNNNSSRNDDAIHFLVGAKQ